MYQTEESEEIPDPLEQLPPPLPWERGGEGVEEESNPAFEAFDVYRELGLQRSLAKAAQALGKNVSLLERWNRRYRWQVRVQAWDRHHSRIINERVLMGTAAMRERAAGIGLNLQVKAAKRLMEMTPEELDKLNVSELATMIRIGNAVESAARAISPDEIAGALRDSAPTFHIGFVAHRPEGMVSVRLPSGQAGYIPRERIEEFRADHPTATVID